MAKNTDNRNISKVTSEKLEETSVAQQILPKYSRYERARTGMKKPNSIRILENATVLLCIADIVILLLTNARLLNDFLFTAVSSLILAIIGALALFYGIDGIRSGFIWMTFPYFGGSKHADFTTPISYIVSVAYVILGAALVAGAAYMLYAHIHSF